MTVRYSQFSQVQPLTFGTALTASGTPIPAPSNGSRVMLDFLAYWLVDPAGSNTVTLTLGTVVMPPVGLSSARGSFSLGPTVLPPDTPLVATLAGSGSVGFFGQYNIATND